MYSGIDSLFQALIILAIGIHANTWAYVLAHVFSFPSSRTISLFFFFFFNYLFPLCSLIWPLVVYYLWMQFKTISEKINDIDVFRSLDKVKAEPSEGSSFFRDCLVEWRVCVILLLLDLFQKFQYLGRLYPTCYAGFRLRFL